MTHSRAPLPRARRDRKRTVGLALATVASLFALLLLPGLARAQGDPVVGRDLYQDTAGVSGLNLSASCSNCHGTVQQLRTQRFGSTAWGDVSFDQAGTRLVSGMNRIADMAQFRQLSQQQVEDIAAYIADVPRTGASTLAFTAPAVGSEVTQVITLQHAISATAAGQQLVVTGTRLGGAAATPSTTPVNGFNLVSNGCAGQTLNAAGTCTLSVRYLASASPANVALELQLRVGSTNFSRSVALQGSLAGAAPPPPGGAPAPGADSGGGGALGLGWLLALMAAATGLARRRA
jgi:mono/diheme cytochrome c family protein